MPGRPNILAVMFRFGRRTASYFQHADREDDDVEGGSIRVVIARDHKNAPTAAVGLRRGESFCGRWFFGRHFSVCH